MFAASLILGVTILGFAAWLEWRERERADAAQVFDKEYLTRRRKGRFVVHIMLAMAGLLVLLAGFAGRGILWVALWSAVCGLLVLVVAVAMIDLWRTNRYLYRKLPEIRRQTLGPSSSSSSEASSESAPTSGSSESSSSGAADP